MYIYLYICMYSNLYTKIITEINISKWINLYMIQLYSTYEIQHNTTFQDKSSVLQILIGKLSSNRDIFTSTLIH